ncbi:MAG: EI24 domain-containing protein [Longispora sp.]|nr:EI24 domain-containing protein [Longispora sp. (in: high G+C Gram-positive bacteria)]
MWVRSPGLMALGMIPAVIAGLILVGITILVWINFGTLLDFLTGFADDWDESARAAARLTVGVLVAGASLVLWVVLFTTLTLLIGDPFYEKISERVEQSCGGVPVQVEESWARSLGRSLVDSVRLVLKAALLGIILFPLGFIPLIGQTVVPVLGALVGGWFLVVELTGMTFSRRGIRLPQRRRILASRRAFSVGFGATIFVLFLIPFGAVIITPAAVAGATQLTRELLGENSRPLPRMGSGA